MEVVKSSLIGAICERRETGGTCETSQTEVTSRSSIVCDERGPPDSSPSSEGVGKPSFTARIERPRLYRGGSASKKDGCLPPRILLIVRVPGARDQHECHSSPFTAQFTFPLADFLTILLESAHTYA